MPAKAEKAMTVVWQDIETVTPYERNARTITDVAVEKVARSIREFGWQQPIVIDEEGVIIAGHARLLAARQLGLKRVPVTVAAGLTPEQARAYRLMDNRSHQETSWDDEVLGVELLGLKALDFDLALTGFEEWEIRDALSGGSGPPEDFPEYGADIDTTYECPRCGYSWSGKPRGDAPADAGDTA